MIKDLIKRLVEYEVKISKEIKEKQPTKVLDDIKEGIDILTMNSAKEPNDTDSSLEMLLNSICKSFKMKPKQAAALLTNSNQYLLHSVVKGLKGNYEPVVRFYNNMLRFANHLCNLLELESEKNQNNSTMLMIFNALKIGMFSYNDKVILACLEFFSKMSELTFEMSIYPAVYQWFITTTQEGGISAILYVLKKHEDLIKSVVSTLVSFSKGNLPSILKEIIRPLYPSPREYVSIINDFTHVLAESKETKRELLDSGLIDYWLEVNIRSANLDGNVDPQDEGYKGGRSGYNKVSPEEQTTSLSFVCDLWVLFPEKLEAREDLANQIINILKKLSSERFKPLRLCANSQMFRLLELFSESKNPFAPTLFKNIAYSMTENIDDPITREFIFKNLIYTFEKIPNIPVSFILEPLIQHLQSTEGESFEYSSIDFDLFLGIAKHPKLNPRNALVLIDYLAKIYLNDLSYASCAGVVFAQVAKRFNQNDKIKEFIIKYLTVSISMLLTVEKPAEDKSQESKKKKLQELSLRGKNAKTRERDKKKEELDNLYKSLKKTFIIELARKVQNLNNDDVNDHLRGLCLSTNRRNKELYGKLNIGILVLLKYWGDPKAMSLRYIEEEEDKERKIKEEEERKIREQKEAERRREEEKNLALEFLESEERNDTGKGNRLKRGGKSTSALVPYSKTPYDRIGKKAMLEIDKIKLSRKEKEEIKRNEEKQMNLKIERQKRALKKKLEKRMIEHGVNVRNDKNTTKNVVFKDGEVEYNQIFDSHTGLPPIELINLEEEEERDVDAIKIFMKKYSKLWRFLFKKYANMLFSSKIVTNFDNYKKKNDTINMAELFRFLKDHGFGYKHISKEELAALIRLINLKKIKRFDLTALPYNGFLEFILQASYFIYSREPYFMNNVPLAELLKAFFDQMLLSTKSRGESIILFEDPDSTAMADPELIKILNKKIQEDPNYPLPEGFKKAKEKQLHHNYEVPSFIPMSEAQRLSLEMLDDLIFSKFQFHFLEPIVKTDEIIKVKPIIRREFPSAKKAVPRYLEALEGRTKPKELDKLKTPSVSKTKYFSQRKYNLTENMRL